MTEHQLVWAETSLSAGCDSRGYCLVLALDGTA